MFPEITGDTNEFTFTYLHPGDYFLTVIADMTQIKFDRESLPHRGSKLTHRWRILDERHSKFWPIW